MRLIRGFHITSLFFWALAGIVLLFVISFWLPFLFYITMALLALIAVLVFVDTMLLFIPKNIAKGHRKVVSPGNLGDKNPVNLYVSNLSFLRLNFRIYDEVPDELIDKDLYFQQFIPSRNEAHFVYHVEPKERGSYEFYDINVLASTILGLVQRRERIKTEDIIRVYPSILQMKKYELMVFKKFAQEQGIKKIRRLGHNNEFEQIKNYIQGDDIRTINWKATSRRSELMVNQYQDERSQSVYSIVDKSRSMKMPFKEMSLLDYAINATLAFTNVSIKKGDKAGLITYSDKIGTQLKAERSSFQVRKVLEALFAQKTHFNEASYELLYYSIKKTVKGRSLIMLYTNFESEYALKRALPILRKINKQHLLVVVFFENTEVERVQRLSAKNTQEIYVQTLAEKESNEKMSYTNELRKYGIQAVLTTPENLTIDTINKYLEIKSKGMI